MKRRNFIAGGCAAALAPLAGAAASEPKDEVHPETGMSYKDMYWAAQSHINALEQENSELRAHAMIMDRRRENSGT